MAPIGVGIIGASPGRSWSALSHVPALAATSQFELRAVSTSRRASADAAAAAFAVDGFDHPADLIAHPDVDLVVVAVKAPDHHELLSAAIAAGKMVFSEWPLGANLDEARALRASAERAGVHAAVGLQARFSPALAYVRDLIRDGYVGDVLASNLLGSGLAWGPTTTVSGAYVYDVDNGATTLSIGAMHALDGVQWVLGELRAVAATAAVRRRTVEIADTGGELHPTAADHIAISGLLDGGAVMSVYYRGGTSRAGDLRWEINGSDGDLLITSDGPNATLQVSTLRLRAGRRDQPLMDLAVPPAYTASIPPHLGELAANMAGLYAQLATDIRTGTHLVPDFAHAVRRHDQIHTIETAAALHHAPAR